MNHPNTCKYAGDFKMTKKDLVVAIALAVLSLVSIHSNRQVADLKRDILVLDSRHALTHLNARGPEPDAKNAYLIETGRYVGEVIGEKHSDKCPDCVIVHLLNQASDADKSYPRSSLYIKHERRFE